MAREGISKAQVFNAADQISATGQAPTVANVRAHLGSGSYTTITAMLREWKAQADTPTDDTIDVPEIITTALGRAAEIVWKAAQDHFAQELAAVKREAERHATQYRTDLEEATAEIERLEGVITSHEQHGDELTARINSLDEDLQKQFRINSELITARAELRAELRAAEARIKEQTTLLNRLVPEKKTPAPKKKPAPKSEPATPPTDSH